MVYGTFTVFNFIRLGFTEPVFLIIIFEIYIKYSNVSFNL